MTMGTQMVLFGSPEPTHVCYPVPSPKRERNESKLSLPSSSCIGKSFTKHLSPLANLGGRSVPISNTQLCGLLRDKRSPPITVARKTRPFELNINIDVALMIAEQVKAVYVLLDTLADNGSYISTALARISLPCPALTGLLTLPRPYGSTEILYSTLSLQELSTAPIWSNVSSFLEKETGPCIYTFVILPFRCRAAQAVRPVVASSATW